MKINGSDKRERCMLLALFFKFWNGFIAGVLNLRSDTTRFRIVLRGRSIPCADVRAPERRASVTLASLVDICQVPNDNPKLLVDSLS